MTRWFPLIISCTGSCVAASGAAAMLLYAGGMDSVLDLSESDRTPLSLLGAILFTVIGLGQFLCGRYIAKWYKYGSNGAR